MSRVCTYGDWRAEIKSEVEFNCSSEQVKINWVTNANSGKNLYSCNLQAEKVTTELMTQTKILIGKSVHSTATLQDPWAGISSHRRPDSSLFEWGETYKTETHSHINISVYQKTNEKLDYRTRYLLRCVNYSLLDVNKTV